MKILSLDTAQGACSAAVWQDGTVLARRHEFMRVGHAEQLVPMAMQAMAEAGMDMSELDQLACTVGPGTFTGTRVALSAARGMALGLKIPLIGVTTLEAVASAIPAQANIIRVACFDAKRGELYCQAFGGMVLIPLTDPQALSHEAAAKTIMEAGEGQEIFVAGTGATILAGALALLGVAVTCPAVSGHPDAGLVAEIAATKPVSKSPPAPLYLRAPDAKIPAPK